MMRCFAVLLLSLSVLSCIDVRQNKLENLLEQWMDYEVKFPVTSIFTIQGRDTVDFYMSGDYKIVTYIDTIGCTSCKLQLHKWKELIEYTDSATQGKVPFLFFFHPKDAKEIRYLLKRDVFDRPVCIDIEDQLNKLNKFPSNITFQTFLLDKNNKVVVLGNPVHNTAVKDLYLKQITGKDNPNKNIPKTTAEATQTEIDFGTFGKSEVKETTIEVRNIGDNPLVIVDVSTTCGCTAATYDKRPANPGESLRVGIKMTPKDTGFFDEVVTIKYNSTNNQPVKAKIKGYIQ